MREVFTFFGTKAGLLTLIMGVIGIIMWSVNKGRSGRSTTPVAKNTGLVLSADSGDELAQTTDSTLKEKRTPFVIPAPRQARRRNEVVSKAEAQAAPAPSRPVHLSTMNIFTSAGTKERAPDLGKGVLPYGQLIRASTVNALDSAISSTPIIALVTHDLYFQGEKLLPAGTQLHGSIAGSRNGRITSDSTWAAITLDGRELVFKGIALDRSEVRAGRDFATNWGLMDGAAGIQGKSIESQDFQDIKLFAAAFLSGLSRGSQTRSQSIYGQTTDGGIGNGMKEGLSDVLDKYAQRIEKQIRETGRYVFVAPGKEFYVYNLETVDFRKSKKGATTYDKRSERSNSQPVSPQFIQQQK